MRRFTMLLFAICLATSAPVFAQRASDEAVLTYDIIRSERKNLTMESMDITAAQRAKLEPIYDAYLAEHDQLEDHRLHVAREFVAKYKGLSDAEAEALLEELSLIYRTKDAIHQKYTKKFMTVLPARLVLRLWQIESKMDVIVDMQFAKEIPLAR